MRTRTLLLLLLGAVISVSNNLQGCKCEEELSTFSSRNREGRDIGNGEELAAVPPAAVSTQRVIPENCMFPLCCCPHIAPPPPNPPIFEIRTDDGSCSLEERCCC